MHWSGKKMLWDRRRDVVELFENGVVNRKGETLKADYIKLDLQKRTVDAVGRVEYIASQTVIQSEELHFNLDTGAGTIVNGQVSNGRFLLVGERINRLSANRFQTHKAEYTTCHDCPSSWTLAGEDVDMEVEGYAHMKNVKTKIKDTPVFWFPYMVVPVKTKRQTGLLFPRFGGSALHGFIFVQPFFWATSESTDMTFGLGTYSERGRRMEWEGRYALSGQSTGQVNFFHTKDVKGDAPQKIRWGLDIQQQHEFPYDIQEKLRFTDVSDNRYPIQFSEDVEGRGEPVMESQIIFSQASAYQTAYVEARRDRNLLNLDSNVKFDPNTVQLAPKAEIATNDRFLFGSPLAGGLSVGVSNYMRPAGPFDEDPDFENGKFDAGKDPVREATRFRAIPSLYTTLRPHDVVSVIPSVQYRSFYYNFHDSFPSLSRGYLLLQLDLTTQLERVYHWEDDFEIPRTKHLIRPLLRYNRIPYTHEPDHPFISQIKSREGYNFDNDDIVPIGTSRSLVNYFVPLGNSITYGATTQIIRRIQEEGAQAPEYERTVEVSAGQTLNILELQAPEESRVPLSRAFVFKELSFEKFRWQTEYFFYPYLGRIIPEVSPNDRSPHEVTTSTGYTFEKTVKHYVLEFERSVNLSYSFRKLLSRTNSLGLGLTYSINDYFQPVLTGSYDLLQRRFLQVNLRLNFQSPSRCWKLVTLIGRSVDQGLNVAFEFALNLTGEKFGGFTDI